MFHAFHAIEKTGLGSFLGSFCRWASARCLLGPVWGQPAALQAFCASSAPSLCSWLREQTSSLRHPERGCARASQVNYLAGLHSLWKTKETQRTSLSQSRTCHSEIPRSVSQNTAGPRLPEGSAAERPSPLITYTPTSSPSLFTKIWYGIHTMDGHSSS